MSSNIYTVIVLNNWIGVNEHTMSLPANRGGRVCVAGAYLNQTSHALPLLNNVGPINIW